MQEKHPRDLVVRVGRSGDLITVDHVVDQLMLVAEGLLQERVVLARDHIGDEGECDHEHAKTELDTTTQEED